MRFKKRIRASFFLGFFLSLLWLHPLPAQEIVMGEGEYRGFIVNEGQQVVKVGPIQPGQTLQIFFSPQWMIEQRGKLQWRLEGPDGVRLREGSQDNPQAETTFMEWTSNSEPRPNAYFLHVQGMDGTFPGEILGQYTLNIFLWGQNDGNSGTDAPESFEKALFLPVSEPGTYLFEEGFISGTADVYDLYKILLQANNSLMLKVIPAQWEGGGKKDKVHFEFLNRSFQRMKEGNSFWPETSPFVVKIFHPRVRPDTKPALFYLMVKMDGEVSLIYGFQVEVKEGR
ncbi:MAG: hypothetical protein A2Z51_09310 [Deltaproteobacteria bacterium RBG_19FT_COMBO_52_11]|nr:MAG: hypothetical protein A2Z51_09310 [Deltaproteobacteria bacterium RBG_19FT_COMBO_52_11]